MKKLYFLISALVITATASAQDFVISPSPTLDRDIDVGIYDLANIDLAHDNSTSDSIELQWEIITNTIPTGWDYSYCDYTNCYTDPLTQTSGTMTKIGPGQMAFFKVTLNASTVDNATLKLRVYKTGDAANADTLTFNYISYVGISDIEMGKLVSIYPNPSNGESITITNILPNTDVRIVNSLGQSVFDATVTTDKLSIKNMDLKKGVYFVHFSRANKSYTTRKLIVK